MSNRLTDLGRKKAELDAAIERYEEYRREAASKDKTNWVAYYTKKIAKAKHKLSGYQNSLAKEKKVLAFNIVKVSLVLLILGLGFAFGHNILDIAGKAVGGIGETTGFAVGEGDEDSGGDSETADTGSSDSGDSDSGGDSSDSGGDSNSESGSGGGDTDDSSSEETADETGIDEEQTGEETQDEESTEDSDTTDTEETSEESDSEDSSEDTSDTSEEQTEETGTEEGSEDQELNETEETELVNETSEEETTEESTEETESEPEVGEDGTFIESGSNTTTITLDAEHQAIVDKLASLENKTDRIINILTNIQLELAKIASGNVTNANETLENITQTLEEVEEEIEEPEITEDGTFEEPKNETEELNETVEIDENITEEILPDTNITELNDTVELNITDVNETIELNITEPLENITEEQEINITEVNVTAANETAENTTAPLFNGSTFAIGQEELQYDAEILKPVKWKKTVVVEQEVQNLTVTIPENATLLKVTEIEDGVEKELPEEKVKEKKDDEAPEKSVDLPETEEEKQQLEESLIIGQEIAEPKVAEDIGLLTGNAVLRAGTGTFDWIIELFRSGLRLITGAAIGAEDEETSAVREIIIDEVVDHVEVEYLTEAPRFVEETLGQGKRVTISSQYHYENVLAYTDIPEASADTVRLYHLVNGTRRVVTSNFNLVDTNENNLIDRVEWVVPHLSNQTYEVVIEIITAEHLDENRTFISDIYNETKELDSIWSETIPDGHYVRATFEQNLTSTRDITVFPRIVNGTPTVEVYEVDGTDLITTFGTLTSEAYNTVYLTNLTGSQDTFDLRVLGGSIEIDHIIDPPYDYDTWYNFSTYAEANNGNWLYESDNGGSMTNVGLADEPSANGNAPQWQWVSTGASASSGTGPPASNTQPTIFPETSSPVAAGDVAQATLQVNTSASTYNLSVTFDHSPWGVTSGTSYFEVWNGASYDVVDSWAGVASDSGWLSRGPYNFGNYSNADFHIRFRTVAGSTTYQNDFAFARVRMYGDSKQATPTTPTSITCDGTSNCNISVDTSVVINASGSTDSDGDNITYFIEAALTNTTTIQNTTDVNAKSLGGGSSGDWGDTSQQSTSTNVNNWMRCMGGTSANIEGMTLSSISISSGGTGNVRLGVYQGGTLSDPNGANLVWDAGTVAAGTGFVTASGGTASLTANEITWICVKGNDNTFSVHYDTTHDATSDFQSGNGRYLMGTGMSTDETVAYESTVSESGGSFSNFWYSFYLNYTVAPTFNETNTSTTTYEDMGTDHATIDVVNITVEVDTYNPAASVDQGTNKPDLWLEMYNGSDFIEIGNFSLPSTYTGSGLDTTNHNFTVSTTDSNILTAWENSTNQDLRIMGRYLDYNGSVSDEINYTNIWMALDGRPWTVIGNHTETTTLTWNTTALAAQNNIDLRARAIDLTGSNTYSEYYTKNSALNISHGGEADTTAPTLTLVNPQNVTYNTTLNIPVDYMANDETAIDECFYSVNSGANATLAGCLNATVNATPGFNIFDLYVNDTSGNLNSSQVNFTAVTNSSLVINFTKNPVELLEEFNITANYTDEYGSAIQNATCILDQNPSKFTTGIGAISTSSAKHGVANRLYANNTLRADFINVPQNQSQYDVVVRAHRHDITTDSFRVYVRCDSNYTIDSAYKIGEINTSDGAVSPDFGLHVFFFNNSLITSSTCSVLAESSGSTNTSDSWMIGAVFTGLNNSVHYDSSDFSQTFTPSTNVSFIDIGYQATTTDEVTMTYNAGTNLYELASLHQGATGTFVDSATCTADNTANRSDNETLTVEDNIAPLVEINEIIPNPASLGTDNVTINWVGQDLELDTKYINVTYPNGSLLVQDTNSPLALNTTQLSVVGTYNVTVFANDTSNLNSTISSTFLVSAGAPFIHDISTVPSQAITEAGQSNVTFYILVTDQDGVADINDSTINATFFRSGEAIRSDPSCSVVGDLNASTANYTCTIGLWYFDGAGVWDVNATAKSTAGETTTAYNETFQLNETTAITTSPGALTWDTLTPGATDKQPTNGPAVVNNTGNKDITSGNVRVTGYDLFGETTPTYTIPTANFTVTSDEACVSGIALVNATATGITDAALSAGNLSAGAAQANLYFCLEEVPTGITSQSYSGQTAWVVDVV